MQKKKICIFYEDRNENGNDKNSIYEFLISKEFYKYSARKVNDKGECEKGENVDENDLFEVFKYDSLHKKNNGDVSERHKLLSGMKIDVCPYCNMNYTINYFDEETEKAKSTADLDHFYVKSKHPLYALCLYNFIPACGVCNSRLKLDLNMNIDSHIYPFENSFGDDAVFMIKNLPEKLKDATNLKVKLKMNRNIEKISNSSSVFKIEERYNSLNYIVEEIVNKVETYNKSYREEIKDTFTNKNKKSNHKKSLEDENLKRLIFGSEKSEKELVNESLGKLKNDLLKQLGVF